MKTQKYTTQRLLLRQWKDSDRKIFSDMNMDSLIMQHFPRTFNIDESNAFVDEATNHIRHHGWGAWAVEEMSSSEFIGFVGFSHPAHWHPCSGHIDIGCRLRKQFWGQGFATEAASKALQLAFNVFNFSELVSFTAKCNQPSVQVMRKIGLIKKSQEFDHPRIAQSSPLCRHVVYGITQQQWVSNSSGTR